MASQDEQWLLSEKYGGEKSEAFELLQDFIAFLSSAKIEQKDLKEREVNTRSSSELLKIYDNFCAATKRNDSQKLIYHGEILKQFVADVERIEAGEPLAYVIGHAPFLNTTIHYDSKPLVARAETEFWVEKAIAAVGAASVSNPRILDLCAGSGAIGIAVAKAIPTAHVTFGEIDPSHLPTIGKNLEANNIDCTRYNVFQSDLYNGIPNYSSETSQAADLDEIRGAGEFSKEPYQAYRDEKIGTHNEEDRQDGGLRFDFILSNPPYIDPALDRTEPSVKNFEPHRALYGGRGGLELIKTIIHTAPAYLAPGGQLWLEHEPEQAETITAWAAEANLQATTHRDQYNVNRYTILIQ